MSKKVWIVCGGCLITGLVIGYYAAKGRDGSVAANTMAILQFTDMAQAEARAIQAYKHESVPVAIYAMTELLQRQKAAEQIGETPFLSKQIMSVDLMLTHARLAKLYGEAGETNLSEQHFAEALHYAEADGKPAITNRDTLMGFVEKIDKGAR